MFFVCCVQVNQAGMRVLEAVEEGTLRVSVVLVVELSAVSSHSSFTACKPNIKSVDAANKISSSMLAIKQHYSHPKCISNYIHAD
jgi:hypothetical protein